MARLADVLRVIGALALLGLTACATAEPINPALIEQADEIPPGPGLATGEEGAIVLHL